MGLSAGAGAGESGTGTAAGGGTEAGGREALLTLPEVPSLGSLLWDLGASVRTWGGYKDNPQLSSVAERGSALMAAGGDLYATRLPADGRELTVFATLEHTEYVGEGFAPETMGIVDVRGVRRWDGGWFVGGEAQYLYFRQVFDASDITGVLAVLRAEGHLARARPSVGAEWDWGGKVELAGEGGRQWLAAPLDDYWDGGARWTGTRDWGPRGSLAVSYRFRARRFDERVRTDADGNAVEGLMRFRQHEVELAWRRTWDERKRWRTSVKLGWVDNQDNGGGYFDYHRIQLSPGVRFVSGRWEARAEARVRGYLYPVQVAEAGGEDRLRRLDFGGTLRGQVRVWKGLRFFAQYEYDASDSNETGADYDVNSAWVGLELEYEPTR